MTMTGECEKQLLTQPSETTIVPADLRTDGEPEPMSLAKQ
jgi:hypothetical protein